MAKASEHLRDARRGWEAAFLQLFDDHYLPVFRFAWRLTGSIADAEDIVQECFLALLRPGCAFDPSRAALRTYLFGAVRNQFLNRLRRREQGLTLEPVDRRTPETEALRGETADAVARAIADLPQSQREVLLLAHYEQLSLSEIAEITELEVTAVKSRLQRARASLRETWLHTHPEWSGSYERNRTRSIVGYLESTGSASRIARQLAGTVPAGGAPNIRQSTTVGCGDCRHLGGAGDRYGEPRRAF